MSVQFMPENCLSSMGTIRSHHQMSSKSRNPTKITAQTLRFDAENSANFYEVLRIKQNASSIEIKTAYRSLAKRFHPDAATKESNSGNFIAIHQAYATLSDPTSRTLYDLSIGAANRFRYGDEGRSDFAGVTISRRWETDQCW